MVGGPGGKKLALVKPQQLSPKDSALFKAVVKYYTTKQYKKGLKAADTILKSNPLHGETLSMKGLILNYQDKKMEAFDYVHRGVQADITSHVCWHTFGLWYRSDRNYPEAIKCYLVALKHDKDNLQILRDLSLLQIQMRDLHGYHDTRRKILTLKPNQMNNWLAFAMAAHLLCNYEEAVLILDLYVKTRKLESGFEYSEMLLYKNQIIEESGKFEEALEHLNSVEQHIVDKLAWKEKRASLLSLTSRHTGSESAYRALLQINPENQNYHRGIIAAKLAVPCVTHYEQLCHKLSADQQASLEALYNELAKEHPRSLLVRRVPLEFLHGDKFKAAFSAYIRPSLRKGVPSLFIGLKALYSDEEKKQISGKVIEDSIESLTESKTFPFGEDGAPSTSPSTDIEPPSSLLWALYFAAQHYDRLHEHQKAITLIDRAIAHTPTVIELYTLKAKVLQHAGDALAAYNTYEKARELDLADRYLNTKATLFALRADQMEAAERTIALFTKEGADSQDVLNDMQCMWYETESAASYLRTKEYGKCLKKLTAVDKHFADIIEDQFDFHTYCLRKMTLRAYLSLLRLEDKLFGLKFYRIAAKGIVNAYISIFDSKPLTAADEAHEPSEGLSAKERKRIANLKKQAAKKDPAASASASASTSSVTSTPAKPASGSSKAADEDPEGKKLASVADPLGEAHKYLRTLLKYSSHDVEVQLLSCKLNLRRHKYLQVVQALNAAIKLGAKDHPEVHQHAVELGLAVAGLTSNSTVTSLLQEESSRLLNTKTPTQANADFTTLLSSRTYTHRRVAAELLLKISPEKKSEALSLLQGANVPLTMPVSLKDIADAYDFVNKTFDSEQVEKFRVDGHSHFPLAAVFLPPPPTSTPASDSL